MKEEELRQYALQLALTSSPEGERHEVILIRAEAYLNFMKGQTENG